MYRPNILVIDGPSGSGKTTLISGESARSPDMCVSPHIQEMPGYTYFEELQTVARHELTKQGISTEHKHWEASFLEHILQCERAQRIPGLQALVQGQTAVLDKSHFHFYANAHNLGVPVPQDIKDFYDSIRYDAIFLCEPVRAYNEQRSSRHSFEKAQKKFVKLKELYVQEGYTPTTLPIVEGDLQESAKLRMEIVRSTLGIE